MGALEGRHALITGGGTGIGAAIARAFAAQGCAVSIAGRRLGTLEAIVAALPKARMLKVDVTDAAQCAAMVTAARSSFGPLDIVVANAGAAESASFGRTAPDLWRRMIDVNLTGTYNTAFAAIGDLARTAAMEETPLRRLILVSSTAGLKGYPYVSAYVAAKHGVIGLMRALAVELARTPVTVNAICPGFTQTPLLDSSIAMIAAKTGRSPSEAMQELAQSNPQGRLILPEEVAATACWLASAGAGSITGQALSISGGEV